jgi:uncharacterized protein YdaU (DUF1376 family)
MAKDPAFLFYSSDFMMGTALMSESEVGQYIRILCHMHQSGHLSLEDMKNICSNISPKVVAKFRADDNGLYYNERLDAEVLKRKNYSESRRNNRLKNKPITHDESYVPVVTGHMENENENINVLSNTIVDSTTIVDAIHFGHKNGKMVTVSKVYAHDKIKFIHDLREYFTSTNQIEGLDMAGLNKFSEFMDANPSNIFKDDGHLYNSFRKFCTEFKAKKKSVKGKLQ